jgi:uncharacterized membrane protein
MTSAPAGWSTHATAGILIIATLMAFTFWFWFGIGVISAVNPPEATSESVFGDPVDGDYFSTARLLLAAGVSLVMTAITWAVAKEIAEAE